MFVVSETSIHQSVLVCNLIFFNQLGIRMLDEMYTKIFESI
jgi:hypothetical protein